MVGDPRPVGGRDYPRRYQEFRSWFPDELRCREYLAGLRTTGSAGNICPTTSTNSLSGSTRRTSRARGLLFYRLLQQAAGTDPHPLAELIGGTGNDWDEPIGD